MSHVVVVGAGLGGLSAAIHARLQGWEVTVLEQHPHPGGKAAGLEQSGFRLDPGPSIIIMPDLYREVFRRAGRDPEAYLRFQRLDPFTRVFFEEGSPLDLPADTTACIDLLSQDSPTDRDALHRLMKVMSEIEAPIQRTIFSRPFEKPWQLLNPDLLQVGRRFDVKKSYKELVDGWFRSPLLRSFFYGFPSYGGQTYDSKAAGALMIPYLMMSGGVWYPVGGVAAIPAAFARLAEELGVRFEFSRKVTGFKTAGTRLEAVETEGGPVRADAFIANVDPSTFRRDRSENREPSLSYFTLHWGLPARLPQREHHILVVPKGWERGFEQLYREKTFPTQPIVYLNVTSHLDAAVAPPGQENVFAVVTCPSRLPWATETPAYREATLATLAGAGIRIEEPIFERLQSPPYFEAAHGNYGGSLYGLDERHRQWGLFPPSNRDPDFKNLFYCGGAVQPGAGLPMVTLSGQFAARALGKG